MSISKVQDACPGIPGLKPTPENRVSAVGFGFEPLGGMGASRPAPEIRRLSISKPPEARVTPGLELHPPKLYFTHRCRLPPSGNPGRPSMTYSPTPNIIFWPQVSSSRRPGPTQDLKYIPQNCISATGFDFHPLGILEGQVVLTAQPRTS